MRVPLPAPEGPETTMGRLSAGNATENAVVIATRVVSHRYCIETGTYCAVWETVTV